MNALGAQVRPDLVDHMIELYCDWRTGCADVHVAWERFLDASADDRTVAFAAYLAALDREESACDAYAAQIRLVESHCVPKRTSSRRREKPARDR